VRETMARKREKGKIPHSEWSAITARHRKGESLASIARSYGCTAPAIRYIINRTMQQPVEVSTAKPKRPSSERGAVGRGSDQAGEPHREARGHPPAIDGGLRHRVNGDIAVFLVAFDAMFAEDTIENQRALLEATDRLLRAGARTRIALERTATRSDAGAAGEQSYLAPGTIVLLPESA
jgi:hypothetical protein